jgi:hypothetical protein
MPRISCREIYFTDATHTSQIDSLIDKVKEIVKELNLPPQYDVRIYRNVYSCCGIAGLGLIIEVVGPDEETLKAIDLRAMSRVLEFCEKEGYDVGYHSFGQYESLKI